MKKLLVLFFAAATISAKAQNNEAVNAYIAQYRQLAIDEMIRTGVPASITLAQGILESNAGEGDLTQDDPAIVQKMASGDLLAVVLDELHGFSFG